MSEKLNTPLPTYGAIAASLSSLGNYRVLRVQQLARSTFAKPSVLLSLGMRESGLKNICGGARWDGKEWVATFSDRGWLQISAEIHPDWLKAVPGCENGHWSPDTQGLSAFTPMHVPRFTDALVYTLGQFTLDRQQGLAAGVRVEDIVRFCVAAHNAGFSGALNGYRAGDVDANTTHHDYSAWVLACAPLVHDWVVAHPNWVYKGQPLTPDEGDGDW